MGNCIDSKQYNQQDYKAKLQKERLQRIEQYCQEQQKQKRQRSIDLLQSKQTEATCEPSIQSPEYNFNNQQQQNPFINSEQYKQSTQYQFKGQKQQKLKEEQQDLNNEQDVQLRIQILRNKLQLKLNSSLEQSSLLQKRKLQLSLE